MLLEQFTKNEINNQMIDEVMEKHNFNWSELIGHMMMNRTAGLSYYLIMKSSNLKIPSEITLSMQRVFDAQKLRAENMKNYIKELALALDAAYIPHAFLKGAILTYSLFPLGTRASNDVDILINSKDISRCGDVLSSLNYEIGDYDHHTKTITKLTRYELIFRRMNWGETTPYVKITNQSMLNALPVDINFSLDWLPTSTENAVESLLKNTIKYQLDQTAISSLDRESFLIHLCMHLYKECVLYEMVVFHKDTTLYKYVDIYAYIVEYPIDWEHLVSKCLEFDLQKGCYFAFEYVRTLFPSLNEINEFIRALHFLKPTDTDYLNELIDPANPNKKYRWKEDLVQRVFNYNRLENIEEVVI